MYPEFLFNLATRSGVHFYLNLGLQRGALRNCLIVICITKALKKIAEHVFYNCRVFTRYGLLCESCRVTSRLISSCNWMLRVYFSIVICGETNVVSHVVGFGLNFDMEHAFERNLRKLFFMKICNFKRQLKLKIKCIWKKIKFFEYVEITRLMFLFYKLRDAGELKKKKLGRKKSVAADSRFFSFFHRHQSAILFFSPHPLFKRVSLPCKPVY